MKYFILISLLLITSINADGITTKVINKTSGKNIQYFRNNKLILTHYFTKYGMKISEVTCDGKKILNYGISNNESILSSYQSKEYYFTIHKSTKKGTHTVAVFKNYDLYEEFVIKNNMLFPTGTKELEQKIDFSNELNNALEDLFQSKNNPEELKKSQAKLDALNNKAKQVFGKEN